jgi:hypothetical protein
VSQGRAPLSQPKVRKILDTTAARLVFRLHAQSFTLNGGRRSTKAASAASGLGKATKIRRPQLAASSVPSTNPPEEKNERGRNPTE